MRRFLLYAFAAAPTSAWLQPRFGYVPGNDYGVPQNASYDYVVVGGGKYICNTIVSHFRLILFRNRWLNHSISLS
jgi:hypothetical protein